MGRLFAAKVKLNESGKPEFDFGNSNAEPDPNGFLKYTALKECPVCHKGQIYEMESAYVCENAVRTHSCKFRLGKMILQQAIAPEQAMKIITEGKSDVLTRFISKKGRPFSAWLKLEDGKVVFEFPPRGNGKAGAKKKAGGAAKGTRRKTTSSDDDSGAKEAAAGTGAKKTSKPARAPRKSPAKKKSEAAV